LLVDLGEVRLTSETIIANLPATVGSDPGSQVWVDWTGYNNSFSLNASFPLPQDLISPLMLWERINGSASGIFFDMSQVLKGLPTIPKGTTNKMWEWRAEKIYMPGATSATDLRVRYAAYLADFATVGPTQWYQQPVPIMRVLSPLAWFVCSEVAKARGDLDAGWFDQKAIESTIMVFHRNLSQGKEQGTVAESGKMSDKYTPASGMPPRGVK